jgi:protein involved in polysaccharide export with SLBB domain
MRGAGRIGLAILLASHLIANGQPTGRDKEWIPENYRIHIGDRLTISAVGSTYFTYIETVGLQGTIVIRIPTGEVIAVPQEVPREETSLGWMVMDVVPVVGLSIDEVIQFLQDRFNQYYREVQIKVSLDRTGEPIYVSGAVVTPGTFTYLPGRTVEDYIGLAGGARVEGSSAHAQVIQADGSVVWVHEGLILKPGDTILVPEEYVYVQGAVATPGAIPFRPGRTVEDYIGLAGGGTDRAHMKKIRLIKSDGQVEKISGDTPVEIGETIVVPELALKWPQDYLTVVSFLSSIFVTWYLLANS